MPSRASRSRREPEMINYLDYEGNSQHHREEGWMPLVWLLSQRGVQHPLSPSLEAGNQQLVLSTPAQGSAPSIVGWNEAFLISLPSSQTAGER
ncbi:hypothetical protein VULLAG_LOCUS14516 [Vulpes lagopus]